MTSREITWIWDSVRREYYCVTTDNYGNHNYHYQSEIQQQPTYQYILSPPALQYSTSRDGYHQPLTNYYNYGATSNIASSASHRRNDSHTEDTMPDPAPTEVRRMPRFIEGTPHRGWFEELDSSYRVRSNAEAYHFFKVGKVFSMLHIQSASAHALQQLSAANNDNVTVVKYNEHAYSQIRRFVIVDVRHGFVYACPITTYSNRGCLKPGCIPSEHCIVYLRGKQPSMFEGEGITKRNICIDPVDNAVVMRPESRLHYAKAYLIEMNVKVKDIGEVAHEDLSHLVRCYRDLRDGGA